MSFQVTRPRLVCLLAVHNGEARLPGFLASVSPLADAVVALDVGSTDQTRRLLEADPSVEVLLTSPVGEGRREDEVSVDRHRLLAAAAPLEPDWILCLDVDERLAADDARALRELIVEEREPARAYALRVFTLAERAGCYHDGPPDWAPRLFAYEPGQTSPSTALVAGWLSSPVPESLWQKTTIRVQRVAGSSVVSEGPVRAWTPRAPRLPLLLNGSQREVVHVTQGEPVLSAIVISRDDGAAIEPAVAAVVAQQCDVPFEVIVVTSGTGGAADVVRDRFPEVRVVELDHPALPGEARNAGLRIARGAYVSFPGSHIRLAHGSLAARMRAHERGYAMVTGCMLNGTTTAAGWASYFLDHTFTLPGRPSGALDKPPSRCSYLREAVLWVGGFPEDMRTGEDTAVNDALFALGYGAYRSREITLYHHSPCRTSGRLITHHFGRGRGLGRILFDGAREGGDWRLVRDHVLGGPRQRFRRLRPGVHAWAPELSGQLRRVYPLVILGAAGAWAGWTYEILRLALSSAPPLRPRASSRVGPERVGAAVTDAAGRLSD
jgi:Glycosyl transferase family 2